MPNIDETTSALIDSEDVPEMLAREKVMAVIRSLPPQQEIPWVLGADTIVLKDGKIYGKPQNQEEAESFLREFSGKTHEVITALALYNGKKKITTTRVSRTKVTFKDLTEEELQWYLDTGEWHGAAGGYRIQSLASILITKIEGSQSCVTGLPIYELYDILQEQDYSILE